jgi:hypothetical protein
MWGEGVFDTLSPFFKGEARVRVLLLTLQICLRPKPGRGSEES